MNSSELLLHPVRLRIVQAFLGQDRLTTSDLRERLGDVPAATLYRQVNVLLEGDVLDVVEERRVRGAVERTLVLRAGKAHVGAEASAAMSVDEHRRAFLTFTAALLRDFEHYLAGGDVDLAHDLAGYTQVGLHLTDEEMQAFLGELQAVVLPRLQNAPGPGRRRRVLTTILVPDRAAD